MTREQIIRELELLRVRVAAGTIPLGSASGRIAALERRLLEA